MPGLSSKREAAVVFGVAVAGWAFPGVFIRLLPRLPAFPLVGLRLSVAWLALSPFLFLPQSRAAILTAMGSWRCWLLSLVMLIYYSAASPAFLYAPVGEVALVIASAPLFAVIFRYLGGKPASRVEIFGAFLAITGVLVMATPSLTAKGHTYPKEWLGVTLAIAAAIAASVYAIGNRHLLTLNKSPGAIAQVWLTFTLGLLLLPTLITVPPATLRQPSMGWLLLLGAVSTAIPTVAVAASSHRLSPVAATMINPLTSVCASIVAAIVIHETPTVWMMVGGALVLAAVFSAANAPTPAPVALAVAGD